MTNSQRVVDRCVLRLTTTYAKYPDGYTQFKSIHYLNKFCSGYNVLKESIETDGLDSTMNNVINLNEVPDGIYECRVVNETYDREYGELLDFDFQLFPYLTEKETAAAVNDIKADSEFKELIDGSIATTK